MCAGIVVFYCDVVAVGVGECRWRRGIASVSLASGGHDSAFVRWPPASGRQSPSFGRQCRAFVHSVSFKMSSRWWLKCE